MWEEANGSMEHHAFAATTIVNHRVPCTLTMADGVPGYLNPGAVVTIVVVVKKMKKEPYPSTQSIKKVISIKPIKQFVERKFPYNSTFREIFLAEEDNIKIEEYIAKVVTWLRLAKKEL